VAVLAGDAKSPLLSAVWTLAEAPEASTVELEEELPNTLFQADEAELVTPFHAELRELPMLEKMESLELEGVDAEDAALAQASLGQ
jgi:hypothetical protein